MSKTIRTSMGATLALLAMSALATGCSSEDDHGHSHDYPNGHTTAFPACTEITQACHPVDVGEGPIHDCHDLAHAATSEDSCVQKKAECLGLCRGAAADAGAADATGQ